MQAKSSLKEKSVKFIEAASEAGRSLSWFQTSIILVLLLLLGVGGYVSYRKSRPRPVKVEGMKVDGETEEGRLLTVHVAGAVTEPGLYRLEEGSRVSDALLKAGGPSADALTDELNLAARVKDGQKVTVPRAESNGADVCAQDRGESETPGTVNINTATAEQLEELPGIGPSLAQRIVDYRRKNGTFSSVDEIDKVEGIGPGRLESLRELISI